MENILLKGFDGISIIQENKRGGSPESFLSRTEDDYIFSMMPDKKGKKNSKKS